MVPMYSLSIVHLFSMDIAVDGKAIHTAQGDPHDCAVGLNRGITRMDWIHDAE